MDMRIFLSFIMLLLLPFAKSQAEQAYTWIDENGTTHFSEAPPFNGEISAEQIKLLPAPSTGNITGDDFYSVTNQANRMEKIRLENEKLIAERLKTEAETKKESAQAQAAAQTPLRENLLDDSKHYPTYPYYPNTGRRHTIEHHLDNKNNPERVSPKRSVSRLGGSTP